MYCIFKKYSKKITPDTTHSSNNSVNDNLELAKKE